MTVKITKPALNLREELASLRNQGSAYEESKFYIGNLVTNGTFDSDVSGWTTNSKGTFVSSGGVAVLTNTQVGDRLRVYYEFTTVVGKSYTISFTSVTTGLFLHMGSTLHGAEYAANLGVSAGNHSLTFVATTTLGSIQVGTYSDANGATGSIDNISVYEVAPNLVTNGTFDSDSLWNKGTGWTISGGTASSDGSQTSGSSLTLNDASKYETGKTYTVTFTISNYSAGGVNPHIRGDAFGEVSGNGTHTLTGVVGTSSSTGINMYVTPTFVGSIDNIVITQGSHHLIHSTPYGYEVKDVYIDGDLAREGEAYDYTVHDGYIKPTIEPTASTETCLIGVRK